MDFLKKYLCLLAFGLILFNPILNAQNVNANPPTKSISKEQSVVKIPCPCGCPCEAPCDCGCLDGKRCDCKPKLKEAKAACPCGCPCEAPCDCGCLEGKHCDCKPKLKEVKVACPCGCPCEAPCNCGCNGGKPCDCNSEQLKVVSESSQYYAPYCDCACTQCDESNCVNVAEYDDLVVTNSYEEGHRLFNSHVIGIWLPDDAPLFRPFLADPRQITSSVGWRFNDRVFDKNEIDVSYFDNIPLYRWENLWIPNSILEVAAEGALWALFSPAKFSSPLLNADYYIGFPITYAFDDWSFRFRAYHISSHIGDEFLLDHPGFDRRNPSAEYLDFFASYHIVEDIRLYGGLGWIVAQDESFEGGRVYAEGGVEVRLNGLKFTDHLDRLYGMPFYAVHFRQKSEFKNHVDATYVLGYEWGKTCGLRRCLRTYIEYHDGYSLEGQFSQIATNYLSIRLSYGF